ncbi:MAG: chemotaxis protein CheA [Epsilonproteobacteria bacterium]|nr:chemotaxis protein CheA [Campylobacterota bacterium]
MRLQDYLYGEFDAEIVEEFLMMWDIIEDNIDISIHRLSSEYKGAVEDLFRFFHNLKAASGFFKLRRIALFAHFVEEVLEKARTQTQANEEFIDWLYVVAKQLHQWYRNIDNNEELEPINPSVLKLPDI